MSPRTTTVGKSRHRARKVGTSSGRIPIRPIPVSTLRCTATRFAGSCRSVRQCLDHFQRADHWLTVIRHKIFAVFREGGRQHQERGAYTCFYQIDSFRHMGNAQAVIPETDKMTANNICAMPIGVRFNRRPEWSVAYEFLKQTHIVREMVQANKHPGCMTRTTIQILCLSCTHQGWMPCPQRLTYCQTRAHAAEGG